MAQQTHETYAIHVPQGRTARLHKSAVPHGFVALHTDGFSTCNYVIAIGNGKITLTHADLQTDAKEIANQIHWAGDNCEVMVLSRIGENNLSGQLVPFLKNALKSSQTLREAKMDSEHDGIIVSFEAKSENSVHPQIQILPIRQRPFHLIHHPQEQRFLTIQKIRQVIGLLQAHTTNKLRNYQQLIFDSHAWEPIDETEFTISKDNEMTRQEIEFFNTSDPYITICGKIAGIITSIQQKVPLHGDLKELTMPVGFYLESYLNEYDAFKILKRNLREVLASDTPTSTQDKEFKANILALLNKNSVTFEAIKTCFEDYSHKSPENDYKNNICDQFQTLFRHYNDRQIYKEVADFHAQAKEKLIKLTEHGVARYQKKEYAAACNLFLDALNKAKLCCLKNHEELAKAYYNLGRALQHKNVHTESRFFLHNALVLRQNYLKSPPAEIEKIQKAIADCESAQKQSVTTNVSTNLSK